MPLYSLQKGSQGKLFETHDIVKVANLNIHSKACSVSVGAALHRGAASILGIERACRAVPAMPPKAPAQLKALVAVLPKLTVDTLGIVFHNCGLKILVRPVGGRRPDGWHLRCVF